MPDLLPSPTDPAAPIVVERRLAWAPVIDALRALVSDGRLRTPLYLVGGSVRDAWLGRAAPDIDLTTPGDGQPLARTIANALGGAYYPLDAERGVGRALIDYQGARCVIDIARFRGETLIDDLRARDFTVNALAVRLEAESGEPGGLIFDPTGGLADLKARKLRRCSVDSIASDPIRAVRAVRQSAALKFMIEPLTRVDVRAAQLSQVSAERIRDEFVKVLDGAHPQAALRALDSLGLLAQIVPEAQAMHGLQQSAPHQFDVWEHTLRVIEKLDRLLGIISPTRSDSSAADGMFGMVVYLLDRHRTRLQMHLATLLPSGRSNRAILQFAALLHDCGKVPTRQIDAEGRIRFPQHAEAGAELTRSRATALRFSNAEIERSVAIVRGHMQPSTLFYGFRSHVGLSSRIEANPAALTEVRVDPRDVHRFWRANGEAGIDICLLTMADFLGVTLANWELPEWLGYLTMIDGLLTGYFEQYDTLIAPPPLVDGTTLIEVFHLAPSPVIGALLRYLLEAQAIGQITSRDEALAAAREWLTAGPPDDSDNAAL